MNNIKFSVVLPSYNVEEFIGEALQKLLQQTYRDFEVIVVDDAATDDTGKIADSYGEQFNQAGISYQVIHQESNFGVSTARTIGMDVADGDYILFLDPDDDYEKTLLETLAQQLEQNAADVLLFGYTEDYYDKDGKLSYQVTKQRESKQFHRTTTDNASENLAYAAELVELEQATMFGYPWNKAYRMDFLWQYPPLRFQEISHIEDILFNIDAATRATNFTVIPDVLYHYRNQGQVRLTGQYLQDYFQLQKKRIRAFLDLQCKLQGCEVEQLNQRTLQVMSNFYFRAFQSMITREILHGTAKEDILHDLEVEDQAPLYRLLQPYLSPEGRMAEYLYQPLAKQQWKEAYRRSSFIGFVQQHFPQAYARAKQAR